MMMAILFNMPGFNPRACGRRDSMGARSVLRPRVSIHAPAGGATLHAFCVKLLCLFQSTRLREARPESDLDVLMGEFVSIHAPAGGATVEHRKNQIKILFQSTRLREARPTITFFTSALFCFNPRACGRRDGKGLSTNDYTDVSIHAPAGGATALSCCHISARLVSIHAPAGGATRNVGR